MPKTRLLLAAAALLWIEAILAAFYLVHKPLLLQAAAGLGSLLLTLLVSGLLTFNAAVWGMRLLARLGLTLDPVERLLLGAGLGLGGLGLLGFGLAAVGLAHPPVYIAVLLALSALSLVTRGPHTLRSGLAPLTAALSQPPERSLAWAPWLAATAAALSFVLALAPPADSFDALFYHLSVPASWLKEGGLIASNILPHYWFPDLVEGLFVWGLAFGRESAAPLVHWTYALLTVVLVWWWARSALDTSTAWRATLILISMPSLPLLAAWAYTDLALAFYCAAALYVLWRACAPPAAEPVSPNFWLLAGVFCGLAMGVKYTSFILPLAAAAFLLWRLRRSSRLLLPSFLRLALPAVLVASPWYIRNWVWTANPVYPFLFGGQGWDSFLAAQYSAAGSGIGLDLAKLLMLPLLVTQGHLDANYYDGRIGPFWLILFPAVLWLLWERRKSPDWPALAIPAGFGLASGLFWTLGVINSSALWQARLLYPALIPLAGLFALGWGALARLDNRYFRISAIFNVMFVLALAESLLSFGLFTLARHPLSTALGMTSRAEYFQRFQPTYADALALVGQTPPDARVYFLYEPRSYNMPRQVQPDAFLENFNHELYLQGSPQAVIAAWRHQGYTHVLYQHAGQLEQTAPGRAALELLTPLAATENTTLYRIP